MQESMAASTSRSEVGLSFAPFSLSRRRDLQQLLASGNFSSALLRLDYESRLLRARNLDGRDRLLTT